jgi:hypothetical protein
VGQADVVRTARSRFPAEQYAARQERTPTAASRGSFPGFTRRASPPRFMTGTSSQPSARAPSVWTSGAWPFPEAWDFHSFHCSVLRADSRPAPSLSLLRLLLTSRSSPATWFFQPQGEISPGKKDDLLHTVADAFGRERFPVFGRSPCSALPPYPVSVRGLADSLPASFRRPLALTASRFS